MCGNAKLARFGALPFGDSPTNADDPLGHEFSNPHVETRIAGARFLESPDPDEPVVVSAIAWAEFLCGPMEPAEEELALQIVDGHRDLTFEHAGIAARLFNESGRRRSSLSDCLIAAAAIHDGARLATANLADFRRFASAGLKLA